MSDLTRPEWDGEQSRRSFLLAAGSGIGAATALSGCTAPGDGDSPDTDAGGDGPNGTENDGGPNTGTPTDTPMTTRTTATTATATDTETDTSTTDSTTAQTSTATTSTTTTESTTTETDTTTEPTTTEPTTTEPTTTEPTTTEPTTTEPTTTDVPEPDPTTTQTTTTSDPTTTQTTTTSDPTTSEPTTTEPTTSEPPTTTTPPGGGGGDDPERTFRSWARFFENFDPINNADNDSEQIAQQLYDCLMKHPNGEARVVENLVTDVSVSADYRTYTFELKDDVTFHDGTELTADDVVFSFERLAASENSVRTYYILSYLLHVEHETDEDGNYVPGTLAIAAPDEKTFQLRLQEPFAATLDVLALTAFSVIPREIVGDIDVMPAGSLDDDQTTAIGDGELAYETFKTEQPVGTGPFELEAYVEEESVSVTRNEDYHGELASIAGVQWSILDEKTTAYEAGENLDIDEFQIPLEAYDESKLSIDGEDDLGRTYGTYGPLENDHTANYLAVPGLNTFYVAFNCENVPKPVRKAVAYATNQQYLVDQVFKGRAEPAYHLTPPNVYPAGATGYDSHVEQAYPYGVDEFKLGDAAAVMEDAGYGEENRYELTFTTYQTEDWTGIATILSDRLDSVYIDLTHEELPFSELLQQARTGDVEAYALGWIMDYPGPRKVLEQADPAGTNTDAEDGATGLYLDWDGDDDGLSDAAAQAADALETVRENDVPTEEAKETRNDAYQTVEESLWADAALIPTYHKTYERFWYDWADVPRFGGLGPAQQTFDDVTVNERDT